MVFAHTEPGQGTHTGLCTAVTSPSVDLIFFSTYYLTNENRSVGFRKSIYTEQRNPCHGRIFGNAGPGFPQFGGGRQLELLSLICSHLQLGNLRGDMLNPG